VANAPASNVAASDLEFEFMAQVLRCGERVNLSKDPETVRAIVVTGAAAWRVAGVDKD